MLTTGSLALSPGPRDPSLVDAEFTFTPEDFRIIAAILYAESGIHLKPTKSALVYGRLAKRVRALGLSSFAQYCAFVSSPQGEAERLEMRAALTTNVTRFFRENHHFEHLRAHVVPRLAAAAGRGDCIRIWSAACSTGQEPYSIALTLLQAFPDVATRDVRILATDIDPHCLAAARNGVYSDEAIADVPPDLRRRYFTRAVESERDAWRVGPELRSLVRFRELNLVGEWPMRKAFQVIMCRNVVIYFDEPTQQRLWRKFPDLMTPAGILYIGHSERVTGAASQDFRLVGNSTYRLERAP